MLYVAAALVMMTGIAHSWLGERYLLIRLLRRDDLPKLFGGIEFTRGTLRFAWHITTLTWFGLAAILVLLQRDAAQPRAIALVIGLTCVACAALPIIYTRGRHLSWIVFAAIGLLSIAWSLR